MSKLAEEAPASTELEEAAISCAVMNSSKCG